MRAYRLIDGVGDDVPGSESLRRPTRGAFVEHHTIPSSVIAVLIVGGIVGFLVLVLWGAQML